MEVFNDLPELRAKSGVGSGLYTDYGRNDGKFYLLAPTINVPFPESETDTIEINVVTSKTSGLLDGKTKVNSAEAELYMHRDNIKILEEIKGKQVNFLSVGSDLVGYKYPGTLNYTPTESQNGEAWKGKAKITPLTTPVFVENCLPLIIKSAHLTQLPESTVSLSKTAVTISVETKYDGTSITATSDDNETVTASAVEKAITLTPKKDGSTIVRVTSSKDGYKEVKYTILCVVEGFGG